MIVGEEKALDQTKFLFKGDNKDPKIYKAHKDRIYDCKFSPDGESLATASGDLKISIWDPNSSFDKVIDLRGHTDLVERVAWCPTDPNILLSISEDRTSKLWDIRTKNSIHSHKSKSTYLYLAWSPDGSKYAIGNLKNELSKVAKTLRFPFMTTNQPRTPLLTQSPPSSCPLGRSLTT